MQLLSKKYLKGKSILDANRKNGDSYIWHSITKAVEALGDGYKFRIARNISLRYDCWLDMGTLCYCVPFVDIHDTKLTVKDVFYNNR